MLLVVSAKASDLRGSPKRLDNHKKNVSKTFDGKAFNRWISVVHVHGSRPLLAVGVGVGASLSSLLGGSVKTSVLGSAPEPNENNNKNVQKKVPKGHMLYHFSSSRAYTIDQTPKDQSGKALGGSDRSVQKNGINYQVHSMR